MQEHKKAQSKVVTEHDSPFSPRPGTSSSRRLSDKTSNGGFRNGSPLNRKLPMSLQPVGSNSSSSPKGMSFRKGGKQAHGQMAYTQKGFAYHLREDTVSVLSSFSGPFSP